MIYGDKKADAEAIQKMGLLAVKIGQVHALRIDFLPEETCLELSKLYRANIPIGSEEVLKQVDRSQFEWVDERPLASASVGQVYKARRVTGEEVVIKVIKSDFKARFARDVKTLKRLCACAIFFYPRLRRVFDPIGIIEHIEEYTLKELNLLNEIQGQATLKEIYSRHKENSALADLHFPKVYEELSGENIMVSEYIEGKTFDELLDHGLRYSELLRLFKVHGFFMFNVGIFHGDIHPGNILLKGDQLYFVDTGAIGKVSQRLSAGLLNFFDALSVHDYALCARRLNEMAESGISGERFERFKIKFFTLYADFKGKTVKEVSLTKKMMETIKLGVHAGMSFEKGMFAIIKSLMFLDGMVLRCNPEAVLLSDMRQFIDEFKQAETGQDNTDTRVEKEECEDG